MVSKFSNDHAADNVWTIIAIVLAFITVVAMMDPVTAGFAAVETGEVK